jgi:hypothetical protein
VNVPALYSLSLEQRIAEFERMEKLNAEVIGGKSGKPSPKRGPTKGSR